MILGEHFTDMKKTYLEREQEFQDFEINYPIIGLKSSMTGEGILIEYKESVDSEIQYFPKDCMQISELPESLRELASRVWNGLPPIDIEPEPEPGPLTAQQKLEKAGLTVEELKELLGL
jgi:hypothetical protein